MLAARFALSARLYNAENCPRVGLALATYELISACPEPMSTMPEFFGVRFAEIARSEEEVSKPSMIRSI